MITVTKIFRISAAHRLRFHEGKCFNVHGHEYKIEVSLRRIDGGVNETTGMVVDFSQIKARIGAWLDSFWDHAYLRHQEDSPLGLTLPTISGNVPLDTKEYPMLSNPTAEEMAALLLDVSRKLFADMPWISVSKVTVWETEDSKAEVTG
jgi:6-pyruvoyltetrahydropterin/6-carboxytetrahydropterin synthase